MRVGLNSIIILLFFSVSNLFAQEQRDSLAHLISAKNAKLIQIDSVSYRRVEGDAVFFHNNTYLKCDTAIWNVDAEYIDAKGNVRVEQDGTTLFSETIHYDIKRDMVEVRGHIVTLVDKDNNKLKTRYLDYNTKDSVAVFYRGASMRDKDGNIIESIRGTFYAKTNIFVFLERVQMFSDSLFFITDSLVYYSDDNIAHYGANTSGWKDDGYLEANGGYYNRTEEKLFFRNRVYVRTEEQEVWADSLYYDRTNATADLLKNVQMTDTVQQVILSADRIEYDQKANELLMTRRPLFVYYEKESSTTDTLFMSADTLHHYTVKANEIDSLYKVAAEERVKISRLDPIGEMRKQLAEASAKREEVSDAGHSIGKGRKNTSVVNRTSTDFTDTVSVSDTMPSPLSLPMIDTSEVRFMKAYHNVRIFRQDLQVLCDSLIYTGLDSIARLYKDPILWNGPSNQLTSDSMQLVIMNNNLEKGNMMSNAMIISKNEEGFYNQIKGAEMIGYFKDNDIYRFDVMGGTYALFFFAEDSVTTTMNSKEAKMLTAKLVDRTIERLTYFDQIKSDAYPIYKLKEEDQKFKDFVWRIDERPFNRYSVSKRPVRQSDRLRDIMKKYPVFTETAKYFPHYMDSVFMEIRRRDSLKLVSKLQDRAASDTHEDNVSPLDLDTNLNIREQSPLIKDLDLEREVTHKFVEETVFAEEEFSLETLREKYKQHKDINRNSFTREQKREWRQEKRALKRKIREVKKSIKRDK